MALKLDSFAELISWLGFHHRANYGHKCLANIVTELAKEFINCAESVIGPGRSGEGLYERSFFTTVLELACTANVI